MVLEDALLINLDRDRMDRVLALKLSGTWNLHAKTAGRPLDFFIMFSSLSSVFATRARQLRGGECLPRCHGLVPPRQRPARVDRQLGLPRRGRLPRPAIRAGRAAGAAGVLSFTVRQVLALLQKAMQPQHVQVSVMRVEWSRWCGLG